MEDKVRVKDILIWCSKSSITSFEDFQAVPARPSDKE